MKSEYETKQKVNKQLNSVFRSVCCRSLASSNLFIFPFFVQLYQLFFGSRHINIEKGSSSRRKEDAALKNEEIYKSTSS